MSAGCHSDETPGKAQLELPTIKSLDALRIVKAREESDVQIELKPTAELT